MHTEGIIFDLDGVLVFTDKFHFEAWKEMADDIGVYFDEKINNRLRGVSRMQSLDIILENRTGAPLDNIQKAALAERKNETYRKLLQNMSEDDVSGEVRDTLKKLRKKGYKLAIGSSSKNAKMILEKTGLSEYFDAVSDGTNISRSKPDPEVFLKAAEFLGLRPSECAVVEDARSGVDAANSAGMVSVALGDAAYYEMSDLKLHSFSELDNLFN